METVDRRQVLKIGAGAAAAVAAASVLPSRADAAPKAPEAPRAPKPVAYGKVGFSRLWGSTTVYTKTYYTDSRGRKRVKYVKTKKLRTKGLYEGTSTPVLNTGGVCHWIGTAAPFTKGNCVLFAHRTSKGGPLRNIHKVKLNDDIVIEINGVSKTYRVTSPKEIITSKDFAKAINHGDNQKSYITLVACTKPNGLPTSTKYRFLVRAVEI